MALVLSVALALAVARRNESRIADLQRLLEAAGAGELDRRIGAKGFDDLARVGREIDATLDRLGAGIAAIRQVSTDVAHDLRARLSRLRLRLEPLAANLDIARAVEEIDTISATFDAILRLAQLQAGSAPLVAEVLDLNALAREVAELFEGAAEETGHRVTCDLPAGPVPVRGDRELLLQALGNLVANAQRHTPPGEVTIRVTSLREAARIAVCCHGPGIAAQDRARAVPRFVRLDGARSTPGAGLGLSLVAAIAALHNGALRLEDNAPGLCAALLLPRRLPQAIRNAASLCGAVLVKAPGISYPKAYPQASPPGFCARQPLCRRIWPRNPLSAGVLPAISSEEREKRRNGLLAFT